MIVRLCLLNQSTLLRSKKMYRLELKLYRYDQPHHTQKGHINDSPPLFAQSVYSAKIREDVQIGTKVIQVRLTLSHSERPY